MNRKKIINIIGNAIIINEDEKEDINVYIKINEVQPEVLEPTEILKHFVVENEFEYRGLPCVITFVEHGIRCGYVGISESHILYGLSFNNEILYDIDVHGGITYAQKHTRFGINDELWWFGFDTNHLFDGKDMDKAFEYGLIDEELYSYYKSRPKYDRPKAATLEFCINECKKLADQLIEIDNGNNQYYL